MDNSSSIVESTPDTGLGRFEYETDAPFADGGFARVYRARDRANGNEVALKILKSEYEHHGPVVEGFFRDPHIAGQMNHTNIIRIVETGNRESRPYFFAMEFCSGGDLKKILSKSRRLPLARALRYAIDLSDALHSCHAAKLFHGDIKASNVLFRDPKTPVLSDFGNAVDESSAVETILREHVGSPPYMSPEVWELKGYSARSDLYSFGVLLYYMLTGVLPFSGQSPDELKRMHLYAPPAAPSKWRAGITKPLDQVVLSLLEKRPDDRVGSAAEVRSLLSRIYTDSFEGIEQASDLALNIQYGPKFKKSVVVSEFPFRIGKNEYGNEVETNHLVLGSDDPYVSRSHGIIERIDDSFLFIDMSTNGSWVNGTRLHRQSMELSRENTILLGSVTNLRIVVTRKKGSGIRPAFRMGAIEPPAMNKIRQGLFLGTGLLILWYLFQALTS